MGRDGPPKRAPVGNNADEGHHGGNQGRTCSRPPSHRSGPTTRDAIEALSNPSPALFGICHLKRGHHVRPASLKVAHSSRFLRSFVRHDHPAKRIDGAAREKFLALLAAGENADQIIDAAASADRSTPVEEWLDQRP